MAMGLKSLLGTCLLTCSAFSVQAAVVYEFSGTYTSFQTQQVTGPVSFSLSLSAPVSPTLGTPVTFLASAPELTCSACTLVTFYAQGTFSGSYATVGYGLPIGSEYYFYFDPVSFTQSGTYDSQLLDGTNDGVLTTRITNGIPVPEPGTLALLGVVLAGLTMTRRRRD